MQISTSTTSRQDFTASVGEITFSARLYENVVTVNVSGLESGSVRFEIPAQHFASLIEFASAVSAQVTLEGAPEA